MAQTSPSSAEDDTANPPETNPPPQIGLCLATIEIKLFFSDSFIEVYEHLAKLREQGQDEDANKMDNSSTVTALCEIPGAERHQKSFNTIWSAKDFREALYHAVAPSQVSDVWETLFHQAKALTNIFIDPNDSAFTHIARSISQKEVLKLKKAWSNDNKTLKIKDLETMFFPKVSTKLQLKQHKYKTSSRVTGQEYSHGRTMFKEASDEEYLKIFDRLAGYAKSGTSEPSSLDWISLAALTLKTEKLTNDFLHHVMSWFDSEDHSKGAAKNAPRQWIDLLEAGPLANRGGLSEGVLVHRDKSSKEAARCLVQALFEKIREFDGLGDDWTKSVRQTPTDFYRTVSYLSTSSQEACYRQRFHDHAWFQTLKIVKSHTGSQFKGVMKVYNKMSITTESQLPISIFAAVEQFLVTAKLQCPLDLPFLNTEEVQHDFISEIQTFSAAFLYRRIKISTRSDQTDASLAQSSQTSPGAQSITQTRTATAQAILTDSAQILRNAGYHPQPDDDDEPLTEFTLQRSASLPLRLSQQNEAADYASNGAELIDTRPETSMNALTEASVESPESTSREGSEPLRKKRKFPENENLAR